MLVSDKSLWFRVEMKGMKGQSFVSACGFANSARTLSSFAGPCSHMPNQRRSYFSCSELQNPQSSTDQHPLLSARYNDYVDIDRPGGLLSFTEYAFISSHMWLAQSGKQKTSNHVSFFHSAFVFFSFFASFLCDLRLPHNTYIRAYFTLRICDYNQES